MPEVAIIRRVFLLPGREDEAVRWLEETEPVRRNAGQLRQYVVRGQIDPQLLRQIHAEKLAYGRYTALFCHPGDVPGRFHSQDRYAFLLIIPQEITIIAGHFDHQAVLI